jgi:WhiB family redox-sensing transcriptional regulator
MAMSGIPWESVDDEDLSWRRESWMDQAKCRGVSPDSFYPERGEPTAPAKAICMGCVVRLECLELALVNGEKHGIWGGLSERERRRIRRTRNLTGRDVVNGY